MKEMGDTEDTEGMKEVRDTEDMKEAGNIEGKSVSTVNKQAQVADHLRIPL